MTAHSPESIVQNLHDIGSLPSIFMRISEAVNNPNTSIANVSKIISDDPSVASKILRLANSAFYGIPGEVDKISQAVVTLGLNQVRDLALGTSVISMFKGIPEELITMEEFWKHSIATAMVARSLAICRHQNNAERSFVGGLLHDVGRLILLMKLPEETEKAFARAHDEQILLFQAERQELGFTHTDVARALLENWALPKSLTEAVTYHHHPQSATQFPLETVIVHVADIAAHSLLIGNSGERFVPPVSKKAWEFLAIESPALIAVLKRIEREIDELISILLAD